MNELQKCLNKIIATIRLASTDSPRTKKLVADEAEKIVVERTKKGFGVFRKQPVKLGPLARPTVKKRRYLKRKGKLAGDTTPEKANLTESGAMLKDVEARPTKDGAEVILKTPKSREKAKNNKNFMDITKEEKKRLVEIVEKRIQRALNKL